MMAWQLPKAGTPCSEVDIRRIIAATEKPDAISIVLTYGPERLGSSLIVVTDLRGDEHREEAFRIVMSATPVRYQLHALIDGELVSQHGDQLELEGS